MTPPVFFRQGPLTVGLDGDDVIVRHGVTVTGRIAPDDTVAVDVDASASEAAEAVVRVVIEAVLRRRTGWFHVHAGVVVEHDGRGATLIAGPSGAGKTTTTLALSHAGGLSGDDVGFLMLVDGDVVVMPFVRPLHLGDATARMFPEVLAQSRGGTGGDTGAEARSLQGKLIVDVPLPEPVAVPVTRLVLPQIGDVATTTATPLRAAAVLPRLLVASASVAWPLPGTDEHLRVLGRLATVPAWHLILGRDALDDASVIVRTLSAPSSA